jgi:hypothetical protein
MNINIEERKPIWIALSKFYLDIELQDYDFKCIATKIKESPYTLEEVKEIDKHEIFPILHWNLLSVAGVWDGFHEEWLLEKILERINKRNRLRNFFMGLKYARLKWMCSEYWKKIEVAWDKA